MSGYNATARVEWGRLSGDDDDDEEDAGPAPAPAPTNATPATADVAVSATSSAVSWSVTIDGVPIDVTIRAHGADKTKNTSAAATVARQLQLAARVRAATHTDAAVRTVLRALVPAQAQAAVKAASYVVKLARSGKLRGWMHKLRGGARVLGRALEASSR